MILDTSFLIDLFDGQSAAFEAGRDMADRNVVQRVPAPVVTELSYGVTFGDEEERRQVDNALRMYPIVDLDGVMADRAGELLATADRRANGDSGVEWIEAMIGAVADQFDEPVVTANVDDFERLGVDTETY
ncbi:MAG: PIN domain-containing protein [Halococcoides sp.]